MGHLAICEMKYCCKYFKYETQKMELNDELCHQ